MLIVVYQSINQSINIRDDMAATYLCNSSVRGYHVYQSVWSAEEGENLMCKREMSNPRDNYAVIV